MKSRTNYGQKFISFRGPKVWNQLPVGVKVELPSVSNFKGMLKDVLFS